MHLHSSECFMLLIVSDASYKTPMIHNQFSFPIKNITFRNINPHSSVFWGGKGITPRQIDYFEITLQRDVGEPHKFKHYFNMTYHIHYILNLY